MFEGTYIILRVGMETSKTTYLAPRPNRKKYGQFGLHLINCLALLPLRTQKIQKIITINC